MSIKVIDPKYFIGYKLWFIISYGLKVEIVQDYAKNIFMYKDVDGVWKPRYSFARHNGEYDYSIVSDDYDDLIQLIEQDRYDIRRLVATTKKEVMRDVNHK